MKSRLAALSLFCIKVYAEHGEHADGFLYFGGGLSVFKIGEIGDADVREPGEFGLSEALASAFFADDSSDFLRVFDVNHKSSWLLYLFMRSHKFTVMRARPKGTLLRPHLEFQHS